MKGYGEYKKIDAQWLGTIPSHWKSPQLREVLKDRKEKVSDKEFPPLSVCKAGIVPQLSTAAKSNAGDNRKGVRTGDFVINSRSDRRGSSGISKYEGSVSLISHVLCPRGDVAGSFLHYLLRSHSFIEEFYRNGRGIVADLWTTRFDEMKAITLPIPPREEQNQIVRYLDAKVGKINKLIRIKQQQIALLKEKKQAIINQAVTKGLDSNTPMKDSGIVWIGQIPEGWEVKKLKRFMTRIVQGWSPQCENRPAQNNELCVLKVGCVNDLNFDAAQNKVLPEQLSTKRDIFLKKNMILVSRANTKSLVGLAVFIERDYDNTLICDKLYSFFIKKVNPKFAVYSMRSSPSRCHIENSTSGASSSMQNITQGTVREMSIALPHIEEQNKIVDFCAEKMEQLSLLTALYTKHISTLTEYRTRLVSDVVTGKVDVRHIPIADADILPETEADLTLEDESDDSSITAEEQ